MRMVQLLAAASAIVAGCNAAVPAGAEGAGGKAFQATPVAQFAEPWAMTFLPDGRLLVTEKKGALKLMDRAGRIGTIAGTPEVSYGGQGGLGDVVLHPDFASNNLIYLSWAEAGTDGNRGAVVGRGRLLLDDQGGGRIDGLEVIWRQDPKMSRGGHFSHRIAFGPDGHLFITSGDRQEFTPAQDMNMNLGKVIRLTDSGGVPADNPFADKGPIAAQVWTLGHRNLLGIAFDGQGQLWTHEMGPRGGDEFNLIERGENYIMTGAPFPTTTPDRNSSRRK
jgi:glucose/arabinose dehydrogenase